MHSEPTFLIIGAAKSGTTSLCNKLSQHKQVCFSAPKEVKYFSHDENYAKGLDWYRDHFDIKPEHVAIGEGSVHYSMRSHSPKAVARIKRTLPRVKIVYLVRHPLDRILSHYRMYERSGNTKFRAFEEDLLSGEYETTLVRPSMYWHQLSAYRNEFSDKQIHIIFLDSLRNDPQTEIARLCDFLNVERLPPEEATLERLNANAQTIRSSPKSRFKRLWKRCFGEKAQKASADPVGESLWTKRAHQFAVNQLAEDTSLFLKHCGKPSDYWPMDMVAANERMRVPA
ncbi:sulfotransferase family protein [Cerasicoccus frondis]|uniref:sulfotransferase family protein n=1 Tax=Cerasicoccus frondis TaxID=490090 RepID=UPI002852BD8D|nr:sulfotransferase [Cerasicoccus frondis]